MEKIILKNKESAIAKGYGSNWAFVNDKVIAPNGVDVTYTRLLNKEYIMEATFLEDDKVIVYIPHNEADKKFLNNKIYETTKKN